MLRWGVWKGCSSCVDERVGDALNVARNGCLMVDV